VSGGGRPLSRRRRGAGVLAEGEIEVLLVGDLILDEPRPDRFFDAARPVLRAADLVVGHVEVPFSTRTDHGPNPNPGREPAKLKALARAGIGVATLAGNHVFDAGRVGVQETLRGLERAGIAWTGAGPDLESARRPAVVERRGVRVGVLSFNCVGPRESWAGPGKAGAAYVEVLTHYELDHANPGGPPGRVVSVAVPDSLEAMQRDIERTRPEVDLLVVALHKGVVHVPALLAMYERPLARAAVEAGADVVVGHHAHLLRGIEVYRGRPIFHGLGNFVTVTRVLGLEDNPNPGMLEWARRRRELFGFTPDPAYPTYPFHPEARHTMIARVVAGKDGVREAGFLPCWVAPDGRPLVCGEDELGASVVAYVEEISRRAGLETRFRREGCRVVVTGGRG
jgi:poly-gamma-glutamate capsule biosynthesis protein CapA/YwtB (metallophosphatase superfamily)